MKILKNEKKVDDVLSFNPVGIRKGFPLYTSPILLSFICLLVREKNIDLNEKTISYGEIYNQMVRCLYQKFIKRKQQKFEEEEFRKVLFALGKLAMKTLTSAADLRASDIPDEIRTYAFDYGILIGQEDCNQTITTAECVDGMIVTFSHRSLTEFLGSFNFVLNLASGEEITAMVALDSESPVFMVNPLFLHFCLWFLSENQTDFLLRNRRALEKSWCRT